MPKTSHYGKIRKEYGKLTLDQLKLLIQKLPEIRKKMKDPPKLFCTIPENEKTSVIR